MREWLLAARALIGSLLSRDPSTPFGGNASKDWLPPVLGPADWSQELIATMADGGAAWYFDRR
jgi:hypothetical protein